MKIKSRSETKEARHESALHGNAIGDQALIGQERGSSF
jgi:hypothetical protein